MIEVGIANEFVEFSVPKKSIVLGFYDPNARHLMEFATDAGTIGFRTEG